MAETKLVDVMASAFQIVSKGMSTTVFQCGFVQRRFGIETPEQTKKTPEVFFCD